MLERQCIYKSYLGRTFLFDRLLLAYVMIPIMQREVNTFVDVVWNCHRIREQRDTFLPDGVPNHIYSFPDKYGLEDCGRYLCNFFLPGFYLWSVSGFQVKTGSRAVGIQESNIGKVVKRYDNLQTKWIKVNLKHHSLTQVTCNDCVTVVKPPESDCQFEKWNCKIASYFRFMGFLQYMTSF